MASNRSVRSEHLLVTTGETIPSETIPVWKLLAPFVPFESS